MDVFIVRAHQPGFTDSFEIAGPVADDMADDRDIGLARECPILGVWRGVQLKRQQLVGGREVLRL